MSPSLTVLVVDDEAYVRDSICKVLESEGLRAPAASSVAEALAALSSAGVDVVVSDLRMPGGDVFELLERLGPARDAVPVIVITGVGTVSEAVRAMKLGAFDFLQKPVDPDELLMLVERAAEHLRLRDEVESLRETIGRLRAPRALVGGSEAMERVRERVAQAAPTDAPVLITGESGTGKELVAEELHRQSARASSPLRRLRCATAGEAELESALAGGSPFGRRPSGGSPSGDPLSGGRRAGGTLLLDEVGLLSDAAQALLASRLDEAAERPPDLRVVATSNADLEQLVDAGRLRADLFWRLNVVAIELPPLREHREDLPELCCHFLAWSRDLRASAGAAPPGMPTPEALELMSSYSWPGNVRELRNVLERAVIVAGDRPLDVSLLRDVLEPALSAPVPTDDDPLDSGTLHLRPNLDAAEKDLLLRALAKADGLKKQAAYLLGIDPRNLGYYLRKHGLQ